MARRQPLQLEGLMAVLQQQREDATKAQEPLIAPVFPLQVGGHPSARPTVLNPRPEPVLALPRSTDASLPVHC